MKINSISLGNIYKPGATGSVSASNSVANTSSETFSSKIQDTITISQEGCRQKQFAGLTRKIAGEIVGQDNPARIEELRAAINEGTYQVSAKDVAKAMMSGYLLDAE